jgi:8-oxo-dGTP pyrophosphatase MutT (NUDIX family)
VYEYEFDVEKHDGRITRLSREIMERGNAVAVLGHDPNSNEVVLGHKFRPGDLVAGDYPYRDNLIAGGIGENETALEAAVREMREETGRLRQLRGYVREDLHRVRDRGHGSGWGCSW